MAAPNIVNVATIIGKTAVQATTTSAAAIVSNGSGSNKVLKINALYAANTSGGSRQLTVDVFRSSTSYKITSNLVIPAGATITALDKSLYLEEGDSLRILSDIVGIDVVCSYEEIA